MFSIFFPITFITVRYSKMVPHVSIESNTSMSFFMGYVFGPKVALIYGPVVGITCYMANSFVSPSYISAPIIAGLCGALAGLLKQMFGMSFVNAFVIALVVRNIIAIPWFMLFVAPLESFTHQTTNLISNLLIYLPLLSAVYSLIAPVL